MDPERVVALYSERFGRCRYRWERQDPRAATVETLTFQDASLGGSAVVYASLGGLDRRGACEAVIACVAPSTNVELCLDTVLRARRAVRPLGVVEHVIPLTLFVGLLVLPVEDGAVALGEVRGKPRFAFRVAPLTRAELSLARTDPDRVLALLRGAGALVADPLRACLVDPDGTVVERHKAWFWLLDDTTRRVSEQAVRRERLAPLADDSPATKHSLAALLEDFDRVYFDRLAFARYLDAGGTPGAVAPPGPPRHLPFPLHRLTPVPAQRVARRALVFAALVHRARVERDALANAEAERARLAEWVASLELAGEIEAEEQAALDAPFGSMTGRHGLLARFANEGLAVLAWALGRTPALLHDVVPMGISSCVAVGLLRAEGRRVLASPELRAPAELLAYFEGLYAFSWRIRHASPGRDKRPMDLAAWGRLPRHWFGTLALERLSLVDGDLVLRGRPVHLARVHEVTLFGAVSAMRLRAISWLFGVAPTWAATPGLNPPRQVASTRPADPRTPAASKELGTARLHAILTEALRPASHLRPLSVEVLRRFLTAALGSHPQWLPLVAEALLATKTEDGVPLLRVPFTLQPFSLDDAIDTLVPQLALTPLLVQRDDLASRGKQALHAAVAAYDEAEGMPFEGFAWWAIVEGMLGSLHDSDDEQVRAFGDHFSRAAHAAAITGDDDERARGGPAERLAWQGRRVAEAYSAGFPTEGLTH